MKRRLQVLVVAVLIAVGLVPAAPAQATSACGITVYCQYNWYTDTNWTTLVGQRTTYCDGSSVFWGQTTGFRQTISYTCGDN